VGEFAKFWLLTVKKLIDGEKARTQGRTIILFMFLEDVFHCHHRRKTSSAVHQLT
jgi:hypothetical protein